MITRSFLSARRRGVPGTAQVLAVTRTSQVSRSPEAGWHAPWIYRFVLLVSIPGRPPYVARCRAYAPDIQSGATVPVAVSPRWLRHVTIGRSLSSPGDPGDLPCPAEGAAVQSHDDEDQRMLQPGALVVRQ